MLHPKIIDEIQRTADGICANCDCISDIDPTLCDDLQVIRDAVEEIRYQIEK